MGLKDLDPKLTKALQAVADSQDALLMSFIAPEKPVKTSPVDVDYASITLQDIYNIEKTIEELQSKRELPAKLHLVIHTPGGSVYATTKIANYLRELFGVIEAYVPYEAASGGTALCLAANTIVMDKLSNLTPIDPQTRYKGQWVSAATFAQAVKELEERFSTYRPEQIPSPWQQMCEHLDPILLKEKNKIVIDMVLVAWELLKKSQNPRPKGKKLTPAEQRSRRQKSLELLGVAKNLAQSPWPHTHIIRVDEARQAGLSVSDDKPRLTRLKIYKKWVSNRLGEPQASHIIEYFSPTEVKKTAESKKVAVESPNETTAKQIKQ